jgi:cytidylate kinase
MQQKGLSDSIAAALASGQSYRDLHSAPTATGKHSFTICISREPGSNAMAVARELGPRLGWPVYDKELLDIIGKEMGLRSSQLELLDEKPMSWLEQAFVNFASEYNLNHETYVIHLLALLRALGSRGQCIIVGRGANYVLPVATTLRVKLVADLPERIAMVREIHGLSEKDANHWIERTVKERHDFIKTHFHQEVSDVHLVDVVFNLSQFSTTQVADMVLEALKKKQEHVGKTGK